MKDKKKIVITLFCVISVLLIAVGVTYSIFTYTKKGDTENTVTSGKLTFLYTENTGTGTGINITNAFPVSDELGKAYSSDSQVFDFKVESEIVGNASIPYEVTVAKTNSSTLSEDYVKIYLTDTTETEEVELLEPTLYSNLPESSTSEDEKQIYYDVVEANEDYEKDFRLRMWVSEDSNQEEINEKTFTIKVGVYSNSSVIKNKTNVLNVVAKDKNGNDLAASSTVITGSEKQILLNKLVSTGFIDNANKVGALVDIQTDDFTDTATTTIDVSSIAVAGDKIVVFHYNETLNDWEYISTTEVTADGTIEVSFSSFSPVGLVTVKNNDFTGIKLNTKFATAIFKNNTVITEEPHLGNPASLGIDPIGLYKSTLTNSGEATYYFRGNVNNNYVSFAGQTWRIIRINEDGTVRLIMQDGIENNTLYNFTSNCSSYQNMYYSNSDIAKPNLESWYQTNLASYNDKIATGDYFCEQAKVRWSATFGAGNAQMAVYIGYNENFRCETDGNGYGIINSNIGLITIDELVFAGNYYDKKDETGYLRISQLTWSMSPSAMVGSISGDWLLTSSGYLGNYGVNQYAGALRPVINLKADVKVSGTGTSTDPYVVQ